jgi:tetratricopeptide (TPR) repeat protein
MADAFGRLAAEEPSDAAAWYNRAICLAWLGSNREAVACLDRAVELEAVSSRDRAVEAWTLAELLRQGGGAQELADDLRFACSIDWDPDDTDTMLAEFPEIRRLPAPQAPGVEALPTLQVEIFEWPDQSVSDPDPDRIESAAGLPIVLATVFVDRTSRRLRLSSPRVDTLEQAEERLLARIGADAGAGIGAGRRAIQPVREASPLPLPFLDADVWTVRVPGGLEPSRAEDLRRGWVEHYYEDIWIHRPRQGLGGLSPLAAADASHRGDAVIGAKLAAVIDFREQLASRPSALRLYHGYPFDRLRHRLGIPPAEPAAVDPADLSCAAPWELAAIDPRPLDDHRLVDAVASAAGLLDDAIAAPLAVELLRRQSVTIAGVHLAGAVSSLLRRAMGSNDPDAAIGWIDRARPLADARTAEVLDLWRAEILARAARPDEALRAFSALIGSDAKGAAMALDAAETLIDNGHSDQARPLLEAARDLARSNGLSWTARRAQELLDRLG